MEMSEQPQEWTREQMAEQLHVWYLEATQALDPANYNPKAQKSYAELNEQQKEIDRYIARKVNAALADAERASASQNRAYGAWERPSPIDHILRGLKIRARRAEASAERLAEALQEITAAALLIHDDRSFRPIERAWNEARTALENYERSK
jgi:hypothetical protein